MEMNVSRNEALHSLLFKEGRELVNIKFFPGSDRGLTVEQLESAAAEALRSALQAGPINDPPKTGREPSTLE